MLETADDEVMVAKNGGRLNEAGPV